MSEQSRHANCSTRPLPPESTSFFFPPVYEGNCEIALKKRKIRMDGYLKVKRAIETAHKYKSQLLLGSIRRPYFRYHEAEESEEGDEKDEANGCDRIETSLTDLNDDLPFLLHADFDAKTLKPFVTLNGKELPTSGSELVKLCRPSTYGDLKQHKTKLDPSVRLAYELTPADGLACTRSAEAFMKAFCAYVSDYLYSGQRITARLNKLNVYPKGGFFQEHVDTPRPGMVGSAVVELPYLYTGGTFRIRGTPEQEYVSRHKLTSINSFLAYRAQREHQGEDAQDGEEDSQSAEKEDKRDADTDDEENQQDDNRQMRAMAFYADCPHEIEKVEWGWRVTVSFYLMRGEVPKEDKKHKTPDVAVDMHVFDEENKMFNWRRASSSQSDMKIGDVAARVHMFGARETGQAVRFPDVNLLAAQLTDRIIKYVAQSRQPLGILLSHKYSIHERADGDLRGLDAALDRNLFQSQQQGQARVTLLPVLIHHEEYYCPEGGEPARGSQDVLRFTESDMAAIAIANGQGVPANRLLSRWKGNIKFIGAQRWISVHQHEQQHCEYTGNECQAGEIDNHYFTMALIVEPAPRPRAPKKTARKVSSPALSRGERAKAREERKTSKQESKR